MEDTKCLHEFKPHGLWDGKTKDGKATGGQIFKCTKCDIIVYSEKEIEAKGGVLLKGFDIYGKPIKR